MSDSNTPSPAATTVPPPSDLADLIATTARETPGVIRLEPTLRNMLLQQVDGVRLQRGPESIGVTIELAVDSAHTALPTAELVRDRVVDLLRRLQVVPTEVNVSVLAIDHAVATTISPVRPGR